MKKLYRILALTAIPLFAVRLIEALRHVNPATGFYDSGEILFRIAALVVMGVVVVFARLRSNQVTDFFDEPQTGILPALLYALSAVSVGLASIFQLLGAITDGDLSLLFVPKRQLYLMGITETHFRMEFWCSLVGFAAAAWFAFAAIRFFHIGGKISDQPIFNCLPVVWYCIRAVSDFAISPVNPNNIVILVNIAANLGLALFFLRYARYMSLGYRHADATRLIPTSLLALLLVVGFRLPLGIAVGGGISEILLLSADCLIAVNAFAATDLMLKGESPHEEPELD